MYGIVLVYAPVFRTFSLNSEMAFTLEGTAHKKIKSVHSLSVFSCYWIADWGGWFGLSLAVHYRHRHVCAAVSPHCVWFAGVCICPGFSFPSLALPSSALPRP